MNWKQFFSLLLACFLFTMAARAQDKVEVVDDIYPTKESVAAELDDGNTDNVKQVWGKQLRQYGEQWNRFAKLLVRAGRPVVLIVQPDGNPKSAIMTLQPSDLR